MRSLLALAGVVAVLAFAAALPLGWVATHVANEDGYVQFTTGLVDDPQFRDDIVQAVTDDVIDRAAVPGPFAPAVRTAVESAASSVASTEEFRTAFEQTQRQSHRAVFGATADRTTADRFVIDLAPVAAAIVDAVTGDLPVQIDAPDQLLITIGDTDQSSTIDRIDQTPRQAALLVGVAVVAAVASLLAARRRSSALVWLGLGVALAAAAARLVTDQAVSYGLDAQASDQGSRMAARAQDLLARAALDSFDGWVVIALIAGGVTAVVGLVARAATGSR